MGNQQSNAYKTKSRFRTLDLKDNPAAKNSQSIDYGNSRNGYLNSFAPNFSNSGYYNFKPSSNQRNRKKSFNNINQNGTQTSQIFNFKTLQENGDNSAKIKNKNHFDNKFTVDFNYNTPYLERVNQKQKDRILEKLSKKNQQLRKKLKAINDQLTQKLKKKKLIPKKKNIKNDKNNQQQNSQTQQQTKKQKQQKSAALRRELQNGYRQVDMYKRTLIELKSKQQTQISGNKIRQMENSISDIDRIINQTMKQIQASRNVKKNQQKSLQLDVNQDLIQNMESLKRQEQEIKKKIKEINKRDSVRQNTYKKQQAYLFQVQKKYREVSGQYFPQIKKKKNNHQNKKPSTFDKYTNGKKQQNHQNLPQPNRIKAVTNQLLELKTKHEQYHKKINVQIQQKNKFNQQIQALDSQIEKKDKIIQNLKLKLIEIRKILRPNKKNLFGYDNYQGSELQSQYGGASQAEKQIEDQNQQDQFDIKHLLANIPKPNRKLTQIQRSNSIISGQSGKNNNGMVVTGQKAKPKIWGTVQSRKQQKGKIFKEELLFDDSVQFQNIDAQPLIIGMSVWVNKNNDIQALQAIYLNSQQIRYGIKSSNSEGFIIRYDLQSPDYLKNITGGFNEKGILEYLTLYSKKGKIGAFGNKRDNQQVFTFGLAGNQRPFRFNGASVIIDSQPRINRIGIQICPQ